MDTEGDNVPLQVSGCYTDKQNRATGAEPDQPVCQECSAGTDKDLGSQINMQRK